MARNVPATMRSDGDRHAEESQEHDRGEGRPGHPQSEQQGDADGDLGCRQ
jgi:hypothetical protein